MARADRQQRWRQKSGRKRIEAYLPADTAERLDALASDRGQSRAAVLADLIDAAGSESDAQAAQSTPDASTVDWVGEPIAEATQATQAAQEPQAVPASGASETAAPSGAQVPKHKLRKAHGEAPDGSDAWAVYVESARVGLAYRNTNPNEQRAPSVAWIAVCERDATRKRYRYRTRTQAVEMMLRVERPHERRR